MVTHSVMVFVNVYLHIICHVEENSHEMCIPRLGSAMLDLAWQLRLHEALAAADGLLQSLGFECPRMAERVHGPFLGALASIRATSPRNPRHPGTIEAGNCSVAL